MLQWTLQHIRLDLKYTWKLSRNATDYKTNQLIEVRDGSVQGKGEVAPNIRYGETPENIELAFQLFVQHAPTEWIPIDAFDVLLQSLKLPNALRFGIESAYVHAYAAREKVAVSRLLKLEPMQAIETSFSLPIMPVAEIATFYERHQLHRFRRLKLKVSADTAHDLLEALMQVSNQPLIVDANEGWKDPDALIVFLQSLRNYPIDIIEQPMPADMGDAYQYVKPKSPFPIFADESVCDHADFTLLKHQFHGINMKLMKAGGYQNGIRLLNEARQHGMQTMVGCMVETSLGISCAMRLCHNVPFVDLDGFLIIKDEPFGLVAEAGGVLTSQDPID